MISGSSPVTAASFLAMASFPFKLSSARCLAARRSSTKSRAKTSRCLRLTRERAWHTASATHFSIHWPVHLNRRRSPSNGRSQPSVPLPPGSRPWLDSSECDARVLLGCSSTDRLSRRCVLRPGSVAKTVGISCHIVGRYQHAKGRISQRTFLPIRCMGKHCAAKLDTGGRGE